MKNCYYVTGFLHSHQPQSLSLEMEWWNQNKTLRKLNATSTNNNFSSRTNTTPLLPTYNQQQPPELSTSDIIVIFIYTAILIFGFLGNLLVVHFFGFKNRVKRLYHIYLIHLAVADLISATVTSGYFIFTVVSGHTWYLGEFSCKLISVIGPVTVNVSAWLLVSIAHERYRGITSPLKPRLSKLRIHVTVAAIWFVSFLILIPYVLSIHLVDGWCRMQWSSPAYELTYAAGTLVVQSLVPIIYMTYTVQRILHVLRNRMVMSEPTKINNSKHSNLLPETSFMSSLQNSEANTNSSSTCLHSEGKESNETSERDSFLRKENTQPCHRPYRLDSKVKISNSFPNLSRAISNDDNPISALTTRLLGRPTTVQNKLNEFSFPISILNRTRKAISTPQRKHATHNHNSAEHTCTSQDFETNHTFEPITKNKNESPMVTENNKNTTIGRENKNHCNHIHSCLHTTISGGLSQQKGSSVYQRFRRIFTPADSQKLNSFRQRQRISMLVVTFSVFVVCSLPYNLFYVSAIVIYDLVQDHSQFVLLQNINLWVSTLVVSNSIMNCFIYAGMDNGFKTYCKRLVTCCCDINARPRHQNNLKNKRRGTVRRR